MIRLPLPLRAGLYLALALLLTRAAAQAPPTPTPAEPPEPAASPAVARLLAEGTRHLEGPRFLELGPGLPGARQFSEELVQAEAELKAARSGNDRPGEAGVQRLRARCLMFLNRREEARNAWEAAGRLWREVGDGPGQVEALSWRVHLLAAGTGARVLLTEAVQVAEAERRRPLATATELHRLGNRLWGGGVQFPILAKRVWV